MGSSALNCNAYSPVEGPVLVYAKSFDGYWQFYSVSSSRWEMIQIAAAFATLTAVPSMVLLLILSAAMRSYSERFLGR